MYSSSSLIFEQQSSFIALGEPRRGAYGRPVQFLSPVAYRFDLTIYQVWRCADWRTSDRCWGVEGWWLEGGQLGRRRTSQYEDV